MTIPIQNVVSMTAQDEKYVKCGRKVAFECQHCGRCCAEYFVPIGADDLRALKKKFGSRLAGKTVMVDAKNPFTGKEITTPSLVHPCPFYDKNGKRCGIYAHRPKTCIIFPFFARKDGGAMQYFYSGFCPGIGKGAKVDILEMLPLVKALDKDIAALKEIAGKK
jgi:Fe-S-cluster containining protein